MKTLNLNGKEYEVLSVSDEINEDEIVNLVISITGKQLKQLYSKGDFDIIDTDKYRASLTIYKKEIGYSIYAIHNVTDDNKHFYEGNDEEWIENYKSFSLEENND